MQALGSADLKDDTRTFYQRVICSLQEAGIAFLVCGSYAFEAYTQIARHTKDLDIFIRPSDLERTLKSLADDGFSTRIEFVHWLAKVYSDDDFCDIIFSSGNGLCGVDDTWFDFAVDAEVFGIPVKLCPPEEIIWQKAYIMERERFDGADVAHLLLARGESLDWERLERRFGDRWRLLLVHLILFDFIYPGHRDKIPNGIVRRLIERLATDIGSRTRPDPLCLGTLLSRAQYLPDIERWNYRDARLLPYGRMTPKEVEAWTAGMDAIPGLPEV
jgi:hypothetical protein